MVARGISVVDLLDLPAGAGSLLPADIRAELAKLAVTDYAISTSASAFIYTGIIRSLGEALFSSSLNWPVELPLLNVGVPFQLVRPRLPLAAGADLEPAPDSFQLDLLLERIAIVIPGLRPAKLVASAGTTPAHLDRPVKGAALFGKSVKIVGTATLRIASAPGGGAPLIRFVSPPDPLDPAAPTGALVSLAVQPASFYFGDSDYGMTVDRLIYDDSEVFTPAEIEARGQGPDWRGISIKEATVFFPPNTPAVGNLSAGVRDVLLGSPLGLQGEVRIELGTEPADPTAIDFVQRGLGNPPANVNLGQAVGSGRAYKVNLASGADAAADVSAMGPAGSDHRWILPGGRVASGQGSGPFTVRPNETISVIGLEGTAPDQAESPPVTVQFISASATTIPTVDVVVSGTTRAGVLSVSGARAALAGLSFTLDPATDSAYDWQLGTGPGAQTGRGATFAPAVPATIGRHYLTVAKAGGTPQRVEIEVLDQGELIVGTRTGVFDAAGPVAVRSVEGSYDLPAFHSRGDFQPAADDATVAAGAVSVPAGLLASVTVERGGGGTTPPPVEPVAVPRHVQVLMDYDGTDPTFFIADADGAPSTQVAFSPDLLHAWRDRFSGAQFIVVGRCCDIGTAGRNQDLSALRGTKGKELLASPAALQRGERFQWGESPDAGGAGVEGGAAEIPADMKASEVPTPGTSAAPAPHYDGWLFKIRNAGGFPNDSSTTAHERPLYRRVDLHAVGGTILPDPAAPPSAASQAATTLRRALVPGTLPPVLNPPSPKGVATPYRVRLVVRWDSPSVTQLSDAIPTQAEITIAWQAKAVAVPGLPAPPPSPPPGTPGTVTPTATRPAGGPGPEVFTLVGGWTYDPRTTATQFSLALNSTGDPDGLAMLTGDNAAMSAVATAFALGPALLAGIGSGDVAGGVVRAAVLVGAIGFAAAYGHNGQVIFHGFKVEWRQRAIDTTTGARLRLLCDYTAAIGFDFDQFGIKVSASKPIKVRYREVGIEIDSAKSGFDAFGVIYENASFDIEDPGQWTITGPLGDLIRVAGTRAGSGSTWVELDLKFALDLGIVKITGCTLRASFSDSGLGIEFRGFSASVDLPGVIKGSGAVTIGDGGLIRAGLAASIVPVNLSATASLALQGDFVALEVGVLLPVGIPLASSGLAIYGFVGRFVSNGKRNLDGLSDDPVQRELAWYRRPGQDKYSGPAPGQWAMGLGISVGTMPDTGFTFNALGMLSVGFPDPDIVISIDAKLFQKPQLPAADNNNAPTAGLSILGVIAISPKAVIVGVKGTYLIPKVLQLDLPFGAYFPLPGNPDPAFVRIGADGVNGRTGDPVKLTLLPGSLDINVWAYTMVEERDLLDLGGVDDFDLNGFSIGFGAGWAMQWGGGPIYLRASAKILAGMGTKPLTIVAGLFLEGELRLIIVSVSIRGNVKALISKDTQKFSGEFCGKVDFFFFSVKGCVDCSFGSGDDPGIPPPDHPLTGIDLTNRVGAIVGRAYQDGDAQDPALPPVVWPDTVPLLNFASYIQNKLTGSAFAPNPAELPGEPWAGSTELKYAFRLTKLEIRKKGQAAMPAPLESVWWWPTHRGGVLNASDPDPSQHEGRQLALLSWHPDPWARNLADGGKGTPADPANTVGQLCVPVTESFRGCVRGDLLDRESFDAVRLSGAAGTRFSVSVAEYVPGAASLGEAAAAAGLAGWMLLPGGPLPFAAPVDVPSGPSGVTSGYRLARFVKGTQAAASLGARIVPTLALTDALLTLELCLDRSAATGACDDFADLAIGTAVGDGQLRRGTITYRWLSDAWRTASPVVDNFAPAPDRRAELWCGSKGLSATFDAPVDRVELTVAYAEGEPIIAVALDARGQILVRAVGPAVPLQPQLLVLEAAGIVAVQVYGGSARGSTGINAKSGGSLLKLCRGREDPVASYITKVVGEAPAGKPPQVEVTFADGNTLLLDGKSVLALPGPDRAARRCLLVQYAAPAGRTVTAFRVPPWTGGTVAVVSLCGTDWLTKYIQDTNAAAQEGTAGSLGGHSDPAAPAASERPNLLDADTDYEVVVGVSWAGWRRNRDDPATAQPPSLSDALAWTPFPDRVHGFRTAAEAALPVNAPPADFTDERSFDPRGLIRYLIGFEPDGTGAPHFLDDPILVRLRVDHVEPLLKKYGRALRLKLRRTDPPPSKLASPAGLGSSFRPPDLEIHLQVGLLATDYLEASDALLVQAAEEATCTSAPAVGGRAIAITAPIEPDADYDLLLVAPPMATPEQDQVLITRAHFHTSRYANPKEMLTAMALGIDGAIDPRLPFDALVEPGLPAAVPDPNDADFEAALRALGLDPWPLPPAPRVVALWSRTAPFKLHGILLETDEAMERGARMTVQSIFVAGISLQRIVQNSATTRAIWMATSPFDVPDDTTVNVTVKANGAVSFGRRAIFRAPRMALMEGVA